MLSSLEVDGGHNSVPLLSWTSVHLNSIDSGSLSGVANGDGVEEAVVSRQSVQPRYYLRVAAIRVKETVCGRRRFVHSLCFLVNCCLQVLYENFAPEILASLECSQKVNHLAGREVEIHSSLSIVSTPYVNKIFICKLQNLAETVYLVIKSALQHLMTLI